MTPPLDYQLNKLFYDLHTVPGLAEDYRRDRAAIIGRYALASPIIDALERDDVAALTPFTNGFLMRYYFTAAGLSEQAFLDQLHAMRTDKEVQHG